MATVLSNRKDAGYGVLSSAGPASYATGGFAFDPKSDLAHDREPSAVIVQASNGLPCRWDGSAKKIVVYGAVASNAAAELAATTNLSTVTFVASAFFSV